MFFTFYKTESRLCLSFYLSVCLSTSLLSRSNILLTFARIPVLTSQILFVYWIYYLLVSINLFSTYFSHFFVERLSPSYYVYLLLVLLASSIHVFSDLPFHLTVSIVEFDSAFFVHSFSLHNPTGLYIRQSSFFSRSYYCFALGRRFKS